VTVPACIAAAVIENATTARAYFCANAKSECSIDEHTAFEIGAITKTMTAASLVEIKGRTDAPLAKLLPPGTNVPRSKMARALKGRTAARFSDPRGCERSFNSLAKGAAK
jgi:CubicO group peptidase (beta-lactamase class C family)